MSDYSALNGVFAELAESRRNYNAAVDKQFIRLAKSAGRRWLDIGAGDGKRALALNRALSKDLTLVEPSSLLENSFELKHPELRVIRASFDEIDAPLTFDVVSALWNVVGHVDSLEEFLRHVWAILDEGGLLFFDVNSPLNWKRFGAKAVAKNLLSQKESFSFAWNPTVPSTVNFYRISFIRAQLNQVGFSSSVTYFDYENGNQVRSAFQGSAVIAARKPLSKPVSKGLG